MMNLIQTNIHEIITLGLVFHLKLAKAFTLGKSLPLVDDLLRLSSSLLNSRLTGTFLSADATRL